MIAGAIINFIISIAFLMLAVVFSKGKGAGFIAGYNTMSESKKAEYDEVAMCKFMGKMMYGFSFSVLLWGIDSFMETHLVFIIGLIIFLFFIIFTVVFMNTSNRFKKNAS